MSLAFFTFGVAFSNLKIFPNCGVTLTDRVSIFQSHASFPFFKRNKMSRVAFLALVALVSATAGCGDPTSQVTGTVTMDGSPAAGLVVAFVPKSGGTPNAATTDSSGSYSLVASPGSYKVSISSQQTADTPDTAVDEDNAPYDENSGSGSDGYEALAQGDNYKDAAQFKETVPAKYNQNSELTADLVAGENKDVNFTLTSE